MLQCQQILVSNTLDLLEREAPRLRRKIKTVQLCFTTDPFMYGYSDIQELSMASIRLLNDYEIPCIALTKGVLPPELARRPSGSTYGISLISLDEGYRRENEPGTAPYAERIASLKSLHDTGFKTWVSMEPYPTPNILEQNISEVLSAVSFVDRIIFGRTNHNRAVSRYPDVKRWYDTQARRVITFCGDVGIACHIKTGTMFKQVDQLRLIGA